MKATAIQAKNRLSIFDRLNAAFLFSNSLVDCGWRMSDIVIGGKQRSDPRSMRASLRKRRLRFPDPAHLMPIGRPSVCSR